MRLTASLLFVGDTHGGAIAAGKWTAIGQYKCDVIHSGVEFEHFCY